MKKKIFALLTAAVMAVSAGSAFAYTPGQAVDIGSPGFVGGDFGLLGDLTADAAEVFRADIVIIGAGASGMAAALEAYDSGARNIIVLEKAGFTGGNALTAWGQMAAAGTRYQPQFVDHVQQMFDMGMSAGRDLNDPALVRILAENSADALHWMVDRVGAPLVVVSGRAHSTVDTIAGTANLGAGFTRSLHYALQETGIPVKLSTPATNILVDDNGAAIGVRARRANGEYIDVFATAVILATGGFGNNREMIDAHSDLFAMLNLRNHAGAMGGGLVMAHAIGADIADMNLMTTTDTMEPVTLITYGPAPRSSGAIMVNLEGERFTNELVGGNPLAFVLAEQTDGRAYFIFDDAAKARNADIFANFYDARIITSAATLSELATSFLNIDGAALEATVAAYNAFAAAGTDADFGRATMFTIDGPQFHAMAVVAGIAGTSGGVRINTDTQVLRPDGSPIPALFATGEVVAGVMGYSRGGGHSLADAVVFGRIAANSAVDLVESTTGLTAPTAAVPQTAGNFTNGTHVGTARGHMGDITVSVNVVDGTIVDIEVLNHRETLGFFEGARDVVLTQVIRYQTTSPAAIDAVAGATITRFALIGAIMNALR